MAVQPTIGVPAGRRGLAKAGILAAAAAMSMLAIPVSATDLGDGFRPVTDAGAGPAALSGHLLAWAGQDRSIHLSDLANGTQRALTFLPAGVRVQSLAFDGQWVAWCDDRFGALEPFAMNIHALVLVRLSPKSAPATDITVGGGHVAWLENGILMGTDLDVPAARPLSWIPGLAFSPSLDGDVLVWSQLVGSQRRLAGLDWGGNATLLTAAGGTVIDTDPVAADGHVAWRSESFTAPPDKAGSRPLGGRIVAASLEVGLLQGRNLTQPGPFAQPAMGGPWVAWLVGGAGFLALNLATGATYQSTVPVANVLVSDTHAVVVLPDGSPFQARPWSSAGKTWPVAGVPLPVAAGLLLAMALARLRQFPQD